MSQPPPYSIDEQLSVLRRSQDDCSARAATAETRREREDLERRADVLEAIASEISRLSGQPRGMLERHTGPRS